MLAKSDINNSEHVPQVIDELLIKRKNIKKMFVSRGGNHCILLAEHELFYNNWADSQII